MNSKCLQDQNKCLQHQSTNEIKERGESNKAKRISADRAQVLLYEVIAKIDWYEQALATEVKIKAFFHLHEQTKGNS